MSSSAAAEDPTPWHAQGQTVHLRGGDASLEPEPRLSGVPLPLPSGDDGLRPPLAALLRCLALPCCAAMALPMPCIA